jgi:transcriptional regulator with XRE-family HTH domain
MFGDQHLGKAVALRRESRSMHQLTLARGIGVNKTTMNGYERGTRGMDESAIDRIAAVLECEAVEIWDDAYEMFRYNFLLERAEKTGVAVEELIDRNPRPAPTERLAEAYPPMLEKIWQFLQIAFEQCNGRGSEARASILRWKVLVPPRIKSKSTRATGFRRGK